MHVCTYTDFEIIENILSKYFTRTNLLRFEKCSRFVFQPPIPWFLAKIE